MGKITVWNTNGNEDFSNEDYNFYIGRSRTMKSPLANPFTHNGKKSSLAKLSFETREQAIKAYELYFDKMYGVDPDITAEFDRIYEAYRNGNDIYLQCFCKPKACHGDFIAKRLQERLIKEKMEEMKNKKISKP